MNTIIVQKFGAEVRQNKRRRSNEKEKPRLDKKKNVGCVSA